MSQVLVMPVRRGADRQMAGVPQDLGEERVVLVVLSAEQDEPQEGERFAPGDVVLLGPGTGYEVRRAKKGTFELVRMGQGDAEEEARGPRDGGRRGREGETVVRGDVMGILKKFKR